MNARITINRIGPFALCLLLFALATAAQSTDQNFPTAVTTNEIDGTIKARDMGDSRTTSYFYAFDGGQGDLFINVVAKNFTGDIDVFIAESLTPLAKMVMYSDGGDSETGRLIYLRKPEKLILRVEGRTPNDDPAKFRIKFAGSFIALAPQKVEEAPTVARSETDEPGVKVNSAGRIVAVVPRPRPTPKIVEPGRNASANERASSEKETAKATKPQPPPGRNASVNERAPSTKASPPKKPADSRTVFENKTAKVTVEPPPKAAAKAETKKTPSPPARKVVRPPAKTAKPPADAEAKKADPLASVRLIIQMKDGTVFWMPMDQVLKFTVDKGMMTLIAKDGTITRYNILDVEKTTIQ